MYIDTSACRFCCGAVELGGFGGGEEWSDEDDEDSVESLIKAIKSSLRTMKRCGTSLVYATTMSNQPHAAEALAALGFYTSRPFNKIHNDDDGKAKRKMQAWFLPLIEFKG